MPKLCDGKKANQMNYISISEWATRNSLSFSLSFCKWHQAVMNVYARSSPSSFSLTAASKKNTPLTSYEWFEALNENSVDVGKKEMQRFFCRLQENCTMSLQWRLRPTQLELKMFSDQNKRVVEKVLTSCTTNNIQHHRHRIKNMHFAIFASSRFFFVYFRCHHRLTFISFFSKPE